MILRLLFRIFAAALRFGDALERSEMRDWYVGDRDMSREPRELTWGFCVDEDKPSFVDRHWRCARCGSGSVLNIRAGSEKVTHV